MGALLRVGWLQNCLAPFLPTFGRRKFPQTNARKTITFRPRRREAAHRSSGHDDHLPMTLPFTGAERRRAASVGQSRGLLFNARGPAAVGPEWPRSCGYQLAAVMRGESGANFAKFPPEASSRRRRDGHSGLVGRLFALSSGCVQLVNMVSLKLALAAHLAPRSHLHLRAASLRPHTHTNARPRGAPLHRRPLC